MPCKIECQCCREMDSMHERLVERDEISCITSHSQFSVVCLNKDVLYTALVMINREPVQLPLSNRYARVIKNLIHECIIVDRAQTDWLHIDSLFTGHIVGWVEGYIG